MFMRYTFLTLLILCALLSSACSFGTGFAVVNESDQPIVIRYKVSRYGGELVPEVDPVSLVGGPFIIKASPLRSGVKDEQWLPESEYQVDRMTGAIIVRLLPGEVLRITLVKDYSEDNGPPVLHIEELNIVGAYGEIRFRGKQVNRAFAYKTSSLYTLTYK